MFKFSLSIIIFYFLSFPVLAQLDITASEDGTFTNHIIKYYNYTGTQNYLKSDNHFGTLSSATAYFKYGFGKKDNGNSNVSIGIPAGISSISSDDYESEYGYHVHLMVDYNYGFYAQSMSDPDMKKFGFFVGLGGGIFRSNALPSVTPIDAIDIPKGKHIHYTDNTDASQANILNGSLLDSYGIQMHFGISYLYVSYDNPYMIMLPTGLKGSFHKALNSGANYYTISLLYNYRSLRAAFNKLSGRGERDTGWKYKLKRTHEKEQIFYSN